MPKRKRTKTGMSPGSLIFTGKQHVAEPNVILLQYNDSDVFELQAKDKMVAPKEGAYFNWYDIRGLHNADLIRQFGDQYNIHPLALEDILDTQQRPKIDEYESGIFITAQALELKEAGEDLATEQIAIFFGSNFLISFQEKEDDNFASVRNRLLAPQARIRRRPPDYLAYALLDTTVDYYYPVLDHIEEQIDELEAIILNDPDNATKNRIHHLKRELLTMRKAIVPLREAVGKFSRMDHPMIKEDTLVFVRDLHDHTVQIMDAIDTYRDLLNGLYDLYLSEISFRMNNVMKVLTIISTVFIPLTFLAGIYGMNFKNIPEYNIKYGYYYLWVIMILIFLASMYFFRKKKWL
ncbi:MAG: magnesium/cobalt transporter CorA [Saprospirales bacterium]|nr:magnesium/cobalt transporter CorA [Saprospirales bacterium]MBK8489597.1 magnesium/cobalt transporter CorA [Saprospirales bacterium]